MTINIFAADIETSGLLHNLEEQGDKARFHNFCYSDLQGSLTTLHPHTKNGKCELEEILSKKVILVMHNGISYDKEALKFFGFDVSNVTFVDTLGLSYYLDLNRPKHGLESYGEESGVPKPEVEDWENLTQRQYDHRVQEDVKIQLYTYKKLKARFEELYGKMTDYEFCTHRVVKYINFKMEQLAEQQNTKFLVDVEHAKDVIKNLEIEIETKTEELKAVMPKKPVYGKHTRPAKPFKKDGSLSSTGEKWKELCKASGVPFDFEGEIRSIKGYEEPKPSSPQQIKDWLTSLGWIPETFKFQRESDGTERKIPQIYIQGSGGMICPSIERLAEDHEVLQHLVGLGVLKHRKGVVQGFIDSIVKDNCCEAGANGFTNTLRLKHRKPFVNLPSTRVLYGHEVRSCVVAKSGMKFCCSDLSAMENLWKFNYQIPFDPEYVESQQSDDFDPHLDIALIGGLVTQAEVDFYKIVNGGFPKENYKQSSELIGYLSMSDEDQKLKIKAISKKRGAGKATNYACQYGAGAATVARTAGVDLKVGKQLVKAYKKLNWSIDAIAKSLTTKETSFGTFQLNPINKIWYHLKTEKDAFSTLVQGSGAYLLDIWIKKCFVLRESGEYKIDGGINLVASVHDEQLIEFKDVFGNENEVERLLSDALGQVNKRLGLPIKFGCDTQFGYKYSEIH